MHDSRILQLVYEHYHYDRFCSKCGGRITIALSAFRLGTGWRRCRKCGEVTRDGSREWDELTRGEKAEYMWPQAMRHYFALFVLVAVIIAAKSGNWHDSRVALTWMSLASIILWMPGLFLRCIRMQESRKRFARYGGSVNRDWTAAL